MKNLDLNKFSVQEMDAIETRETVGGSLLGYLIKEICKAGYAIFI